MNWYITSLRSDQIYWTLTVHNGICYVIKIKIKNTKTSHTRSMCCTADTVSGVLWRTWCQSRRLITQGHWRISKVDFASVFMYLIMQLIVWMQVCPKHLLIHRDNLNYNMIINIVYCLVQCESTLFSPCQFLQQSWLDHIYFQFTTKEETMR